MRIALYLVSIVVNGAAIVVRPVSPAWGDALTYVGGALAAFTGVVALSNVETESKRKRVQRIVREELATDETPILKPQPAEDTLDE